LGVPLRYVLHDPGQWYVGDLDLQMAMVAHETKGVYPVAVSLARFLENFVKTIPILIVGEYFLTGIPSKDNVVNCSRSMYARFSCHS